MIRLLAIFVAYIFDILGMIIFVPLIAVITLIGSLFLIFILVIPFSFWFYFDYIARVEKDIMEKNRSDLDRMYGFVEYKTSETRIINQLNDTHENESNLD